MLACSQARPACGSNGWPGLLHVGHATALLVLIGDARQTKRHARPAYMRLHWPGLWKPSGYRHGVSHRKQCDVFYTADTADTNDKHFMRRRAAAPRSAHMQPHMLARALVLAPLQPAAFGRPCVADAVEKLLQSACRAPIHLLPICTAMLAMPARSQPSPNLLPKLCRPAPMHGSC